MQPSKILAELPPIAGARMATGCTGMRYQGRDDVLLMVFDEGTTVAGALTKSTMPGEPVVWCRSILDKGRARALLVNAGYANVFTGSQGKQVVERSAEGVGKAMWCALQEVYLASTGIVGQPVKEELLLAALPELFAGLQDDAWEAATLAIGTTDTFPKMSTRSIAIDGVKVTINGFAKGSGMIAPDMATMLAFIVTDAAIPALTLQKMIDECVGPSFNSITVDSDTSTSDTLLVFATGKAGNRGLDGFKEALLEVMTELAQLVVRDGEGASKFIAVTVKGAVSEASARKIALSIANSPLVKTAIAGEDANWGRIVAAVGKSGERADWDRLKVWIGNELVAKDGGINPDYEEARLMPYMKGQEIAITVDVGVGGASAIVWTCDLTHGYIDINAEYRS